MGFEDRTLKRLDWLARSLNEKGIKGTVASGAKEARSKLFDRVSRRFLGREAEVFAEAPTPQPTTDESASAVLIEDEPAATTETEERLEPEQVQEVQDSDLPKRPSLGPEPPLRPSQVDDLTPLSERHGIDRLVLLPRADREAFAYWEIDPGRLEPLPEALRSKMAELRLLEESSNRCEYRISVPLAQGRAHVQLPKAETSYLAELVVVDEEEEFLVCRSRPMEKSPF